MALPYDTVSNVILTAKNRLNDEITTLAPVSGKILENTQAFTQQLVNTAWRKFQEYLANKGCVDFVQEDIVYSLPPTTNTDPASQVYINWFGYFDGTALQNTPVLPQNLMSPLKIWERQTGTQAQFIPMECMFDGIPTWQKCPRNALWEWRRESIYMPGSTFSMDIRLRYMTYLADFVDDNTNRIPWYGTQVPVMRCQDPLSMFICAEIAETRDDLDAEKWRTKAELASNTFMNRDVKMKQRGNIRRQSRSGRLEAGWNGCGDSYNAGY